MPSSPLVIWRLTDGKPGHQQQTLGLVRALAARTPCDTHDIHVTRQSAGLLDALRGRFPAGARLPHPDLIVGAGHATHLALLAARRATGACCAALMKPSLPLRLFDVVVAPRHDNVRPAPNVITTLGVLNPMRPGPKTPGSVLFLVGGPSKHVAWDDGALLAQLQEVVATLAPEMPWRITDSRRTPAALSAELRQRYGERFMAHGDCPPGWLAERLAGTATVWVSEDSVSMVYEALTAGCQVGLLEVPHTPRPSRVLRGVQDLLAAGHLTSFTQWRVTGTLCPAPFLDESTRVAGLLLARLGVDSGDRPLAR